MGKFRIRFFTPPLDWMTESRIRFDADAFYLKKTYFAKEQVVFWREVKAVLSEKRDQITYEENYLIFDILAGWFWVGELTNGFHAFEAEVRARFDGIPVHWRAKLELNPAGEVFLLWGEPRGSDGDD